MPICRLMMNSSRAPDAAVRQPRERERLIGGADVHHDLDGRLGHGVEARDLFFERQDAAVHEPGVALRARDGDLIAVVDGGRGIPRADDGGDAELARDDRGVAGAPAPVRHDRARALHDRLPVGVGHVGDEHLAGLELRHLVEAPQHARGPRADPLPDRAAGRRDLAALAEHEPAGDARLDPRDDRLGAGLQDVDAPVDAVLAPLDVHRPAVVLLDDERLPGELDEVGVVDREASAVGRRHVLEPGRGARLGGIRVPHRDRLLADRALQHGGAPGAQRDLRDVELVGVDRALHDRLAEAVRARDEHGVLEPRLGVDGEHDARRAHIGADHLLDACGQRDLVVLEPVVGAVRDRAVVVERREHRADRGEHVVDARDVQERLLLAGERGIRQVFGGRRRAHREGCLGILAREPVVRRADVGFEVSGEGLFFDPRADLRAGVGEGRHVFDVDARDRRGDALPEAAFGEEGEVRVGGRREAARHADAEGGEVRDHLAERGVLAADGGEVVHAELIEPEDAAHVSGLSCGARVCAVSGRRRGVATARNGVRCAASGTA